MLLLTSAHLSSVPSRPTCCDHLDLDSACPRPHQGHPPSMVRPTCFWWPLEPTQDALRPISKGKSPGLYPFFSYSDSQPLISLPTRFPATLEFFVSKDAGIDSNSSEKNPKFLKARTVVILLIILVNTHDSFLFLKPFAYTISTNCYSRPQALDNATEWK